MTYSNRFISGYVWVIIVGILCITQIVTLVISANLWIRLNSNKPEELIFINDEDPFIAARSKEFNLPQVILHYEPVISAIEQYQTDHGDYPLDLEALVPNYLPKTPGIYIRNGQRLTYKPQPRTERSIVTPFTFQIYGHYPGLAFMHGWSLDYCPIEFDGCNETGDRHIRQFRINDRWIWIHSSAL